MDYYVHNIKAFVCLAPLRHTAHKTRGAPVPRGLLNGHLMAADFADYRNVSRFFHFINRISSHLSAWQCYIAKYP
jgi:hypothetical protein